MDKNLEFPQFLKFPNISSCISLRSAGDLKPQKSINNFLTVFNKPQINFFSDIEISSQNTVFMEQIHGNNIASCDQDCAGHWIPGADGLVTSLKNLFLCVYTADCVPLFF